MKNLYIIIVFLIFSGSIYSQGNLQNANWVFGDNAWVDFNTGNPVPQFFLPFITPFNREGVASISDENGNIVFWTNGEQVSRLNAGIPVNYINGTGLFGDESSSQNVVIIPRPNHPGIFYIASITGYTTLQAGSHRGLYYSEVNTLTNTVSPTIRNIPLHDSNNHIIDDTYLNISESITVTTAADGTYWLITHIQNQTNTYSRVLSYPVTEDGIGNINFMPSFNFPLPNSVNNPSLVIKVSPDRTRIALSRDGVNPILGTFNDGVINFNINPIGNNANHNACYGVEFSPNSQNLYFTRQGAGIIGLEINNPTVEILIDSTEPAQAIQRAINDRLYIARKSSTFISEIGNPNNLLMPDYTQQIPVNQQTPLIDRTSSLGLPQWVWINCGQTITLSSPNDNLNNQASFFIRHIERGNWINASNVIGIGDNAFLNGVVYHAGNFVDLTPGFDAVNGAQFAAYVEGCTNPDNYVYKNQNQSNNNPKSFDRDNIKVSKSFAIAPNPSSNSIEITMKDTKVKDVSITTIDGRMVFKKSIEENNNYYIDVSGFQKGIYIVTVTDVIGQQFSQKLIKN